MVRATGFGRCAAITVQYRKVLFLRPQRGSFDVSTVEYRSWRNWCWSLDPGCERGPKTIYLSHPQWKMKFGESAEQTGTNATDEAVVKPKFLTAGMQFTV